MSAIYIQVVQTLSIADKMQRITFYSPDFTNMPAITAGLHIKLFFKKPDQASLTLPTRKDGRIQWPDINLKPIARTYSIYHFDNNKNELTVDFVLHDDAGPACDFARLAQIGDKIGFAGPGPISLINRHCKRFIFVCDLSALPAVSSVINSMEKESNIDVFLELEDPFAANDLIAAYLPNLTDKVHVCTQNFKPEETIIPRVLKAIEMKNDSDTSIALAGEHETVVAIRTACRKLKIPKDNLYAVPYWRHNQNEETYHQARHDVMDS